MKQGLFAISILFFLTSCQGLFGPAQFSQSTKPVNTIPESFEKPEPPSQDKVETDKEDTPEEKTEEPSAPQPQLVTEAIPQASLLIQNAHKVMIEEGKKLGSACNRYVQRVLVVSGFANESFLANDFDLYAKKYISHYKVMDFKKESKNEVERLEKYIWSYPERTPFIMQWSWAGAHGHIAIVERIGQKLVIYQANLNRYTARKDQTSASYLLSGFNRRILSVYSELTP